MGEGKKMERPYVYTKGIPIEAQYLYRKALELSDLEKYETALKYFRQAVIIAPRYSKAVHEMGNCLEKLGHYSEAVNVYTRAIAIDPLNTDAQIKRDRVIKNGSLDTTDIHSGTQPFNPRSNNSSSLKNTD
jgi:tetratricopeptide (TPR) repeat protein